MMAKLELEIRKVAKNKNKTQCQIPIISTSL